MGKGDPRSGWSKPGLHCLDCPINPRTNPRPIYRDERCYPHWLLAIRAGKII